MITKFGGKGLKTEAGARARLAKWECLGSTCKAMVAIQDDRFYPVIMVSDQETHMAFEIANSGVTVIRV